MKIVEVILYKNIPYEDSDETNVYFNSDVITEQLMDRLLIVLYDKDILKWNQHVPEGWKYTYEYTTQLDDDTIREMSIKLHNLQGVVVDEIWGVHFTVVDLEEVE